MCVNGEVIWAASFVTWAFVSAVGSLSFVNDAFSLRVGQFTVRE
jgi:hypothetical protein